jgi:HD-GYP domain-containing protein (c-di-GMP phosphodiesterase class II)
MSSSLETLSSRKGSVRFNRPPDGRAAATLRRDGGGPLRLWRYLPLVALTTASVIVLPAVLVTVIVPRGSTMSMAASVGLAVGLSIAIADTEAALWKRRRRSRDILFADLMVWGWLRRSWTERRLARARALYSSAQKAGPSAGIELLASLSKLLEARDAHTHGHGHRVAGHAERIARAMHLPPAEIAKIRRAASVHDVGKLYTPRAILNNPGRLTDPELAVMKTHAATGGRMMEASGDLDVASMVRHHHERMDGHGYPDGLAGSDIPLGARIIAVADTFDSITSNRAYRAADTQKKALDVLRNEADLQLDGVAVAVFLSSYSARRSVAWFAFATAVPQRILEGLQSTSASLGANVGGASILPALGAAGLLTLSPAIRDPAPAARSTHVAPARVAPSQLTSAAITFERKRSITRATNTQPASAHRHESRKHRHASLDTPSSAQPKASTPANPAAVAAATAPNEPAVVSPTQPPTISSSPPPTIRLPTPPTVAPPTAEDPPLPIATVSPPVKIASITVPGVTAPNITTPTIKTPSISIPALG